MKQLRLAVAGLALAMTASCAATAPAFAEPAPKQPGPGPQLPPPSEPPVILNVYPKLLPVQPGEQIIKVRNYIPMEEGLPGGPARFKDSRTWA